MKKLFICITTIWLCSCIKEQQTTTLAYFKNNTSHHIVVLPYKSGIVYAADTIKLSPAEIYEFGYGHQRGISNVPGFSSGYFGSSDDSLVVVFDNIYRMVHYGNAPAQQAAKHYLNTSTRNLGNPLSYQFETEKINKYNQKNTHTYIFTGQDYLDAAQ